jgi:5-methyltetrahydrofolate--homocysteine methyltransferase
MSDPLFFGSKPFLLDGATGTYLMQKGMPFGVCSEAWACDHIDIVKQMHRDYKQAGSQAVMAFTFGANPVKLADYGLSDQTETINQKLIKAAKEAVGSGVLVGGDISPLGQLINPMGNMTFAEAKQAYYRQAKALCEAGADFRADPGSRVGLPRSL